MNSCAGIQKISFNPPINFYRIVRISFLFLLISSFLVTGQQTITNGNILRINIFKPEIDLSDTLWNWSRISYSPYGGQSDYFQGAFKLDNTDYILSLTYEVRPEIEWRYNYLYNNSTKSSELLIKMLHWIDVMDPLHYTNPMPIKRNGGAWLFFSWMREALFVRNDSLYECPVENNMSMIHYAGKIGDKDLVIYETMVGYQREMFLTDLSKAPNIKRENKIEVWKSEYLIRSPALKVHKLNDSTFIYMPSSALLYLSIFKNNKFYLLNRIFSQGQDTIQHDFRRRFFNDNVIYSLDNRILYKETFDLRTKKCINKQNILDLSNSVYKYDADSNYIAYQRNDSLYVYSMNKEKNILSISFDGTNKLELAMISSPYVYYYQVKTVTDINEESTPGNFILYQNYPNPFNPNTKIRYELKNSDYVTLKVYDILGREVTTLVDEFKTPGNYSALFTLNSSLSSGVYFYRLISGNHSITRKMILTK
jgi:hypothetical protein